jgi:hypothetical protein
MGLLSFDALILKRFTTANPMIAKAIPVFLCQLLGATHQPPAGDHTYSSRIIQVESKNVSQMRHVE